MFYVFVLEMFGFKNLGFLLFPGVLEGLGSSGRLVGTISTYPGTYKCPGSRVMTKENIIPITLQENKKAVDIQKYFLPIS